MNASALFISFAALLSLSATTAAYATEPPTHGFCSGRCAAAAISQGTPIGQAPTGYRDPWSGSAKASASGSVAGSPGRSRGGKGN